MYDGLLNSFGQPVHMNHFFTFFRRPGTSPMTEMTFPTGAEGALVLPP
jgi:hypothetical protein